MKVLFLDMDGVLNNVPYAYNIAHKYGGFESPLTVANSYLAPLNVAALKRVIETTGCKVVISSAWRNSHSVQEFQDLFMELGFPADMVIGRTEYLGNRGFEVNQYVVANPHIERYAIVDDVEQFLPDQQSVFVHTDDTLGLTEEDADRLITILGPK